MHQVTHWNRSLCGVWQNVISIVQVFLLQRPRDMALFRLELALGQPWVVKITNHCADPWGEAHGSRRHPVLTQWRPGCQLVYRLQRGLSFLWFSVLCAVGSGATWVYYHRKIKQGHVGSSQLTAYSLACHTWEFHWIHFIKSMAPQKGVSDSQCS